MPKKIEWANTLGGLCAAVVLLAAVVSLPHICHEVLLILKVFWDNPADILASIAALAALFLLIFLDEGKGKASAKRSDRT